MATLSEQVQGYSNQAAELRKELEKAIIGQPQLIYGLVYGVLAGSPISLTGVPGVAKTHASRALACAIDARYERVQVMADMLPSDFTGARVFNLTAGEWTFEPGPLFAEVVHLDELNRVGGRALSGIMEAMEERQVTVAGKKHDLPSGQIIIATFNPAEHAGTEELPDAVADRFGVQVLIERPDARTEQLIASGQYALPNELQAVLTIKDIENLVHFTREVAKATEPAVVAHAVSIVRKTMNTALFERPAGVRASRDLIRVAAAKAVVDNSIKVTADDVAEIAPLVLRHRVEPKYNVTKSVDVLIEELFNGS